MAAFLSSWAVAAEPPANGPRDIGAILAPICESVGVPAMAGAIVTSRGIEAMGCSGVRKRGEAVPVTVNDLWHLGSCTKAMTATIVGMLVDEGKLKWDSTLRDIFGDRCIGAYQAVTLASLLSHRAGLPRNLDWGRYSGSDDLIRKRLDIVTRAFGAEPEYPPGSEARYSNVGYVVAGAVIEKLYGKAWEEVIRDEIFVPLGMSSAGFGGLGTPGEIDQPWGHFADGSPAPTNGTANDNLPVMGPVGRVHCTIQDWSRFIRDQLRGARGEDGLLRAGTYRTMMAPQGDGQMAMGWIVVERPWGRGRVLHHTGSNTMYYANVWLAPARDFAILICANQGGDLAFKATDQAVGALIRWMGEKEKGKGR